MIRSLFAGDTPAGLLRGGLDETSATQRGIAARVAAATASSTSDFAAELAARQGGASNQTVDLQLEMAALADTELRFEACAKLLRDTYTGIRRAIGDRA